MSNIEAIAIAPTTSLLSEISAALETQGFYCLENAIDTAALTQFQDEIRALVESKGRRYFSVINPYKNTDSAFHALYHSPRLQGFLHALAATGSKKSIGNAEVLNVLRVVTGKNTDKHSLNFHYDASVITMLVPLLIPQGPIEQSGHLVAFRNSRNIRPSSLINFIEKILIQNPLSQKLLSIFTLRRVDKYICPLEEGNIYFFYGYRTLHANLPVQPEFIRSTLLFHFGDPHHNSRLIRSIAKLRHWRERLNYEFN